MSDADWPCDPWEAVTVRQAAVGLRVSEPTIRKLIRQGELPSFKIGRCRRICKTDLERFLERNVAYGWRHTRPDPAGGEWT